MWGAKASTGSVYIGRDLSQASWALESTEYSNNFKLLSLEIYTAVWLPILFFSETTLGQSVRINSLFKFKKTDFFTFQCFINFSSIKGTSCLETWEFCHCNCNSPLIDYHHSSHKNAHISPEIIPNYPTVLYSKPITGSSYNQLNTYSWSNFTFSG